MTLALGVFVASILGSLHCAAMCGGFVCAYVAGGGGRAGAASASMWGRVIGGETHLAYHLGRLVSYMTLGAIAGAIGARIDDLGRMAGAVRTTSIVGGSLLVLWAAWSIATTLGAPGARATGPAWAAKGLGAVLTRAARWSPAARAGATGLVTALIPCGWLYTFVVTAGTTANTILGAMLMAVFWIGTVPALLAIGVGAHHLSARVARRLPLASAVVVLILGTLTIAGKVQAGIPGAGTLLGRWCGIH